MFYALRADLTQKPPHTSYRPPQYIEQSERPREERNHKQYESPAPPTGDNATKPEPNSRARSSNQKEPDDAPLGISADWWMVILTFVLAFVGIGQVKLLYHTLRANLINARATVRSARAAERAANVARDAAVAAKESSDTARLTMVFENRAYLHMTGFRWTSHPQGGGKYMWRIRPRWTNAGNTPTKNLRAFIEFELRDTELPEDFPFNHGEFLHPQTIGPKGNSDAGYFDILGEDLADVQRRRKYFYYWGGARYFDIFPGTPERVTKFCYVVVSVTGNPLKEWHKIDNPLEIVFAVYPRHNCADEDCDENA
jgi:hypothetical protein